MRERSESDTQVLQDDETQYVSLCSFLSPPNFHPSKQSQSEFDLRCCHVELPIIILALT